MRPRHAIQLINFSIRVLSCACRLPAMSLCRSVDLNHLAVVHCILYHLRHEIVNCRHSRVLLHPLMSFTAVSLRVLLPLQQDGAKNTHHCQTQYQIQVKVVHNLSP